MNKIKRFVKYFKGGFKVLENISEILKYFKLKYYIVHFYPYTYPLRKGVSDPILHPIIISTRRLDNK